MTAALAMPAYALQASLVEAPEDAMAKIRAAVARAPKGPPLTAEQRARIAQSKRDGWAGIPAEEIAAKLATMKPGPDDLDDE
jgi:hypothetical protein